MAKNLLFLTGKLAEKSLNKVLAQVQSNSKTPAFKYRIQQIGVSVRVISSCRSIAAQNPQTPVTLHCNTGAGKVMVIARRELIAAPAIQLAMLVSDMQVTIPAVKNPYLLDTINF